MHWQYWPLAVTVPAGTPSTAPVSSTWPIVQGHLRAWRIKIPAGHFGRTGIRIAYHGTQVWPWALTGFYAGDNETFTVDWDDEIMATGLVVQAFNTDRAAHTFYLLAEVLPVLGQAGASVTAGSPGRVTHPGRVAEVAALARTRTAA